MPNILGNRGGVGDHPLRCSASLCLHEFKRASFFQVSHVDSGSDRLPRKMFALFHVHVMNVATLCRDRRPRILCATLQVPARHVVIQAERACRRSRSRPTMRQEALLLAHAARKSSREVPRRATATASQQDKPVSAHVARKSTCDVPTRVSGTASQLGRKPVPVVVKTCTLSVGNISAVCA